MMYHTGATPNLPWGYRQEGERRIDQPRTALLLRKYVRYVGCVDRMRDTAQQEEEDGGGRTQVVRKKNGYPEHTIHRTGRLLRQNRIRTRAYRVVDKHSPVTQ